MAERAWFFLILGALLGGCGDDADSAAKMTGVWKGTSVSGLAVTVVVESEVAAGASVVALQGVLTLSESRCLRSAPFAGTLTGVTLEISASGAGSVSSSTFADVTGLLSGSTVQGSLELSGDGQLEACDLPRHALTLMR